MEKTYVVNINVKVESDGYNNIVFYSYPLQYCCSELHSIMDFIRNVNLPNHIKYAFNDYIPPRSLYYYINIIEIENKDMLYAEHKFRVRLSNIRGFKKAYDRYKKLHNYIIDRRNRNE